MLCHQVGKRVSIIVAGVLSLSMAPKVRVEYINLFIISRTSSGRNHPKFLRVCERIRGDVVASSGTF